MKNQGTDDYLLTFYLIQEYEAFAGNPEFSSSGCGSYDRICRDPHSDFRILGKRRADRPSTYQLSAGRHLRCMPGFAAEV